MKQKCRVEVGVGVQSLGCPHPLPRALGAQLGNETPEVQQLYRVLTMGQLRPKDAISSYYTSSAPQKNREKKLSVVKIACIATEL